MNAESLEVSLSHGSTTAYVARPREPAVAGVILIQEW